MQKVSQRPALPTVLEMSSVTGYQGDLLHSNTDYSASISSAAHIAHLLKSHQQLTAKLKRQSYSPTAHSWP
jgi:hypothetical protein